MAASLRRVAQTGWKPHLFKTQLHHLGLPSCLSELTFPCGWVSSAHRDTLPIRFSAKKGQVDKYLGDVYFARNFLTKGLPQLA